MTAIGEETDEKPRTLFVGNIPPSVRKRDLEVLFGDVGPIKRCHIQYPRKRPSGPSPKEEPLVAYITYALTEDATTAIEQFSGHKLESNKLNIKLIKSRVDQYREPRVGRPPLGPPLEPLGERETKPKEPAPRPKKNVKKARLIVRNISFQTNEANLRKHFETCGEVTDVNILRKPSGKLVGCAFVQFKNVHEGFKALKNLNAQDFLGRQIVIDWAVSKDRFQKGETAEGEEVTVKDEPDDEEKVKVKTEKDKSKKLKKEKAGDDEEDDDDEEEEDEDDDGEDDEDDDEEDEEDVKPRVPVNSNDADEGMTLFIRNLSFDVSEEELKEFYEKFGPLKYALICKDPLTEHPKGTGFIKYKDAESASKCLAKFEEDSSEFTLNDRQMFVIVAMSKARLGEKMNVGKEKTSKDNRRLYLAREGFVRPGSDAAVGVSAVDMNKRAAVHKVKNQMLKDLNTFLSDTRLCVHNLPKTLKDENLKKIFLKYAGDGAKITEARIMRDLSTLNRDSKEYGFITFTSHEHALQALRAVNNNPEVFTPNKRPIVEFSLENRKALLAKEKRLEKSKVMAEKLKSQKPIEEDTTETKLSKKEKRKARRAEQREQSEKPEDETQAAQDEPVAKKKKMRHNRPDGDEASADFVGLTGKEGITSLPSLKAKGKITRKSLKKTVKKLPRRMREPKSRSKSFKDETDNVDKMVSKHQKQVKQATAEEKKRGKKWFDK